MSSLISLANGLTAAIQPTEDRRCIDRYWTDTAEVQPTPDYPQGLFGTPGEISYATPWWPRRGCVMDADDGSCSIESYGTATGGCTIRCFVSSTDELVAKVTSDANGNFLVTTPYLVPHYLVIQCPSATPPTAGATVDTLLPS